MVRVVSHAKSLLLFVALLVSFTLCAQESMPGMAYISGGVYRPFYPPSEKEKEILILSFYLDRYPVTQREYLEFVKQKPAWRKDRISRLLSDKGYLKDWSSSLEFGPLKKPSEPVTQVSWFAAQEYCEWKGKRLPREEEWEFVAMATEVAPDGKADLAWRERVFKWYTEPNKPSGPGEVGKTPSNYWGVYDLHGLVWEWVLDFNNNLITSDTRGDGNGDKNRFCGAGSVAASEKEDYPTFMRIAFRSSLKANYTTGNLGFRCARSSLAESMGQGTQTRSAESRQRGEKK